MLKRKSPSLLTSLAWWTLALVSLGCGRSSLSLSRDGGVWGADGPARGQPEDGASNEVKHAGSGGGRGAAGAPQIPCSQGAPEPFYTCAYVCSSCESDVLYPLVCRNGLMACPSSYIDEKGLTVIVPAGMYVVSLDDCTARIGQCSDGDAPADARVAWRERADFRRAFPSWGRLADCEQPEHVPR